jgi:hypothetical protein
MEGLVYVVKFREYLDYLEEHLQYVEKAWNTIQVCCKDLRFISDDYYFNLLSAEVRKHDISKFSEHEFMQYRKVFYPTEGEPKLSLTTAWDHHKEFNLHHWESWTTQKFSDPNIWEIHCAHMVIDWVAMGYKFGDTAQEFYEKNIDKILLPDKAIKLLIEIFSRLESSKEK